MLYRSAPANSNAAEAVPQLPREEALARAAELDAALHRSMRERGEELINPRHLERAAAARDCCNACSRHLTAYDNIAIRNGVLYCGGCR